MLEAPLASGSEEQQRRGRRVAYPGEDVCHTTFKRGCLGDHVVELAVLGALDERTDLGDRVDEGRALREARVADRDAVLTGKRGQLDAVAAVGAAAGALAPVEAGGQLIRWDTVVCLVHGQAPFLILVRYRDCDTKTKYKK